MPITLKRYNSIRRADDVDDQQGTAPILGAITASVTQEEYQVYYLSRLRQIIFGKNAPEHWYDDFDAQGILSLKELTFLSPAAQLIRVGVSLVGPQDGSNRVFRTTPDVFDHDPAGNGRTIEIYHNGRRLIQTDTPNPSFGDYTVEESGGVGTGYDTINLLTFAPIEKSSLAASYHRA